MNTKQLPKSESMLSIKGFIQPFFLKGNPTEIELNFLREAIRNPDKTAGHSAITRLISDGMISRYLPKNNLIVLAGRSVVAQRLAGINTYSQNINYGALGTASSPVPTGASTQLGTEAYRKIKASAAYDANIAYIDFFYAQADTSGTFTEFGNFIDGSAGANTGKLFSYIATGGWAKTSLESLFVSCQYTVT